MSPDVILGWESLAPLLDDGLAALVEAEYAEVSIKDPDMPLALDWPQYQALEDIGILKILSARRGDRLIGFSSFMVLPHLHYARTLHAMNDALYVDPAERGIVGIRMILEAERRLPAPIRILYNSKDRVQFGGRSSTEGVDSLDMLEEVVQLMQEYGIELPDSPLPERGTLGDLLIYLGYSGFETTFGKFVRAR